MRRLRIVLQSALIAASLVVIALPAVRTPGVHLAMTAAAGLFGAVTIWRAYCAGWLGLTFRQLHALRPKANHFDLLTLVVSLIAMMLT